jgi:hypothetical protein
MRSGTATKAILVANTAFVQADILTLTLVGGSPVYLTSWDANITNGGTPYLTCGGTSTRAGWECGEIRYDIGFIVNDLKLSFYCGPDNLGFAAGQDLLKLAVNNQLRGATVLLQTLIATTAGGLATAEKVWLFTGTICDLTVAAGLIEITVKSDMYKFQQSLPLRTYEVNCPFQFAAGASSACGLTWASVASSYTVATDAGNSIRQVTVTSPPGGGFLAGGTILFTSGVLNGLSRTVNATNAIAKWSEPLPSIPAVGVTFSYSRGCKKSLADCTSYSNQNRFPGFKFAAKVS